MRFGLIALALAGAVTLTACGGGVDQPPTSDTAGVETPSGPPMPTLPVADVFDFATWGLTLTESEQTTPPLVLGDRLVILDDDLVRAVDAQGEEAWATPFTPQDTGSPKPANLILVAPNVVAVVTSGTARGEGLDEDSYAAKALLVNVTSGTIVKEVVIPGTASDNPELSKIGLAFTSPAGQVSAVLPSGEVVKVPASKNAGGTPHKVESALTVGNTILPTWETQSANLAEGPGFGGKGWDSISTAPGKTFTTAEVEATDADRLLLGRWVKPGSGPDAPQVRIQVLDAESGEVLSTPKCEPSVSASALLASPNRQHFVSGPMRLESDGQADCVGGGKDQKSVTLTAVTDDGRAFGDAGEDLLVDVAPDGGVKTVSLPDAAESPIGIMDGNVAVHWDSVTGTLTGNPIK